MVGFATVSVQMRGTGCSGGAFDLFGYPSDYDAYDAVEIVAHQAWVANHKVGMVGISYSGLSQLPSAGTDPPDLAAIAPMSPTDDLFSTGYPGGIYNDGFAASWVSARIDDAMAAATYSNGHLVPLATTPVTNVGQPWTYYEIDAELTGSGGTSSTCLNNQALHDEAEGLESLVGPQIVAPGTGSGRDPSLFDRRSMVDWAASIKVPVFLSGALQDEQTGPQWPALIDAIPKTTPLYVNMVNGDHIDSADPQTLSRWLEFLDLYVADKVPTQPSALGTVFLDEFASVASGISATAPLPAIRFTQAPSLEAARADFAANTPLVQVLFDNGAGSIGPGDIESTYSAGFSSWPPAGQVTTLYLGGDGLLHAVDPAVHSDTSFTLDPAARPATSLPPSGNAWAADPDWDWTPVPTADGTPSRPLRSKPTPPSSGRPPLTSGSALRRRWRTTRPPSRGPADHGSGGVRDLRVPSQLEPGGQSRLHPALHGPDIPGRRRPRALADDLFAGEDSDRPDRPHVPGGNGAPSGHLGAWRRPSDLGVRHHRQRPARPRSVSEPGLPRRWWSTR